MWQIFEKHNMWYSALGVRWKSDIALLARMGVLPHPTLIVTRNIYRLQRHCSCTHRNKMSVDVNATHSLPPDKNKKRKFQSDIGRQAKEALLVP